MISQAIGKFTCRECGYENTDPRMMEIGEDQGSLIWCEGCHGWRRWEGGA
jgi:C4-type Zn-finger protein